ncbi:MAG TPA: tetratricopeptide repeat protein [Terracidiphilus sp.]|nr:tetratricopeptide repeat protein [Terracidiphilus sp.]
MPGEYEPKPEEVDRVAKIRSELRNILASEAFKGGRRAQDFLELVVEHALAGRVDRLRERMLGVEMFGRPVDYDTANDAVVRVKASEVRRRLAQYYLTLEIPPPVRISIPTGSYVPQFFFEAPPQTEPETSVAVGQPPEPPSPPPRPWFETPRSIVVLAGSALVAVAVVIAMFLWNRPSQGSPIRSIAVLPLANYSGDPKEDYFADGMTENLISELGRISSLRVISRTSAMSYKGTQKTIPQIAHELSVDAVVEGSVERVGNRVRISAQLIDARSDKHLWAQTLDRDMTDTLQIQSEVAREISDKVDAELTPAEQSHLNRTQHVNADAMELYMRGMQQFNGEPLVAIEYFQQAVDKDPAFAPARAALSEAYGWAGEAGRMPYAEAFAKQREEALKAIQLDDSRPEPHLQLALAALDQNWDWATCQSELERAVAMSPNSTNAHWSYAQYLIRTGHAEEAMAQADVALKLDPLSSRAYVNRAYIKYYTRRYDAALDDLQRATSLPHTEQELRFALGAIYTEKRLYQEAAQKFQELGGPHATGHLGNIYARQGRVREAEAVVNQLKQEVEKSGIGRYEIALIYAGLGDKNHAFEWLELSFANRDKGLTYLKIDPCVDPLRNDPRFQDLVKRVGFPT